MFKQKNIGNNLFSEYLENLGAGWSGQGCSMEIEPANMDFSISILKGLKKAEYNRPYYVFGNYPFETKNINGFIHYLIQVRKEYRYIIAVKGDVFNILTEHQDGPVELCLINTNGQGTTFAYIMHILHRFWIPGLTKIVLFDYYKNSLMRNLIKQYSPEHFSKVIDFKNQNCAVFQYNKKLNIIDYEKDNNSRVN